MTISKLLISVLYIFIISALSIWLYLSYSDSEELFQILSKLKSGNFVLNSEVIELDKKVEISRKKIENLISEQKKLETESLILKKEAQEIESNWQVALKCKRDFESLFSEIEELKQQIVKLKSYGS
ncbi:MAG: hypothetical protein ABIH42_07080 [Planctomycetota bacterium]